MLFERLGQAPHLDVRAHEDEEEVVGARLVQHGDALQDVVLDHCRNTTGTQRQWRGRQQIRMVQNKSGLLLLER